MSYLVCCVHFSPERILEVVANTRQAAIPLHLTLGNFELSWTVLADNGPSCVNQRKTFRDGILGETVLLCKNPAGLQNH